MDSAEARYEVVWPKAALGVRPLELAPRLTDLTGRRVAFLWDYMFRGEEVFPVVASELERRFGVEIVGHEAFGNTHGPDEASVIAGLPDALARWRVDAAISGIGC